MLNLTPFESPKPTDHHGTSSTNFRGYRATMLPCRRRHLCRRHTGSARAPRRPEMIQRPAMQPEAATAAGRTGGIPDAGTMMAAGGDFRAASRPDKYLAVPSNIKKFFI